MRMISNSSLTSRDHYLAMPNDDEDVTTFQTITTQRPRHPIVPVFAIPYGSLARYISADLQQRWMMSTVSS